MKKNIIADQEEFFNQNAQCEKTPAKKSLFTVYANKEQVDGFLWIADQKKILEYGCGTGTSLDIFFKNRRKDKYQIYGVDIAQLAINQARENYPEFSFYRISNNKIPQIKDGTLDAAFMFHVLHHADKYKDIFREIHKKLKKDGKFLINDLSSNNPFNRLGRALFVSMPRFVKRKFADDLVVGEDIPEKHKVNSIRVISQLEEVGFVIQEVGYGHLFFFIFGWIDRFISFSKIPTIINIYKQFVKIENVLLQYPFFQKYAEVFYIKCIKK
jgi:ubiquinone/menaquinone biosynthesis C-methylase UbiE